MSIESMIVALKRVLPYSDTWYSTLSRAQVYAIYNKHVLGRQRKKSML